MSKQNKLFYAPLCPSCQKPAKCLFREVTKFGDPTESFVLEWWCYARHNKRVDPVEDGTEGDNDE